MNDKTFRIYFGPIIVTLWLVVVITNISGCSNGNSEGVVPKPNVETRFDPLVDEQYNGSFDLAVLQSKTSYHFLLFLFERYVRPGSLLKSTVSNPGADIFLADSHFSVTTLPSIAC